MHKVPSSQHAAPDVPLLIRGQLSAGGVAAVGHAGAEHGPAGAVGGQPGRGRAAQRSLSGLLQERQSTRGSS